FRAAGALQPAAGGAGLFELDLRDRGDADRPRFRLSGSPPVASAGRHRNAPRRACPFHLFAELSLRAFPRLAHRPHRLADGGAMTMVAQQDGGKLQPAMTPEQEAIYQARRRRRSIALAIALTVF